MPHRDTWVLAMLLLPAIGCTPVAITSGRSVILKESAIWKLYHLCSRPGPPENEGYWIPSPETIAKMEANFGRLRRLKARECCIWGQAIEDTNRYLRQYVGVVVKGRKLIYINAHDLEGYAAPPSADYALDACDGGSCCWGVLYDPVTHTFFDLAFNGQA